MSFDIQAIAELDSEVNLRWLRAGFAAASRVSIPSADAADL